MSKQHPNFIVVHDPRGKYWEGALVDEHTAMVLEADGVITLPTAPSLFRISGVGAFMKRSWGAGIPINDVTPRVIAPLTLYVEPEFRTIMWAACIVRDTSRGGDVPADAPLSGSLRLVSDSAQPNGAQGGVSPHDKMRSVVHLDDQLLDEHGKLIVRGASRIVPSSPGFAGVGLYGTGSALRVVWAAVSLSE